MSFGVGAGNFLDVVKLVAELQKGGFRLSKKTQNVILEKARSRQSCFLMLSFIRKRQ